MPLRMRPYYPRAQRAPVQEGGFESGWKIGSQIGKGFSGIAEAIQGWKQDQLANRLMGQQAASQLPAAQDLGTLPADTGAPQDFTLPDTSGLGANVGDLAPTGGVAEFNLRREFLRDQVTRAQLANQMTRQRLIEQAASRGDGGGYSPWRSSSRASSDQFIRSQQGDGGGQGKAKKYVPNSSTPNDEDYYNYDHQRADVDSRYGKGTFDRLQGLQGVISQDPKTGKWVSANPEVATVDEKTGDVTLMGKGGTPKAHISADDLTANMKRYDATTVMAGGKPQYSGAYMKSQAPETGKDAGTAENPYLPKDTVDLNAIPPGGYFVNPTDGKVHQKRAPQGGGGQKSGSAQTDTSKADTTDTTDTTDTSSDESYDESEDSAQATGGNVPGRLALNTVDFGQGDQAGLPQDPALAAALRRAQMARTLTA